MGTQRVVCVGNELCHDDGVASVVGRILESQAAAFGDVKIVNVAELGLSSLDAFLDVDHVVVIDAVTTGRAPGSCRVIEDSDLASTATCSIGHAISLSSLLELVAQLNPTGQAPRVTVVGIEAENLEPFGTTLSASVEGAIPTAVELVHRALGVDVKMKESERYCP